MAIASPVASSTASSLCWPISCCLLFSASSRSTFHFSSSDSVMCWISSRENGFLMNRDLWIRSRAFVMLEMRSLVYAVMITTSSSRSTSRIRFTASTPFMPGGIRTSTKATAIGSPASLRVLTTARASSPLIACTRSISGSVGCSSSSRKDRARSSVARGVADASTSLKSSWISF